tara:strand:- start:86 stop:358 length:273 start_codon:yes stop_codon:yes gene_type:complete
MQMISRTFDIDFVEWHRVTKQEKTDALPYDVRGGNADDLVLLSMPALDGILFEYFDKNMETPWTLFIKQYVNRLKPGKNSGSQGGTNATA